MEEKIYKTISGAGVANIVVGILPIVIGIGSGIILVISGGKLLSRKSKIML